MNNHTGTLKFYVGIAKRFSTGSVIQTLLVEFNEEDADDWMAETFPGWIYLTRRGQSDELDALREEFRCPFWR